MIRRLAILCALTAAALAAAPGPPPQLATTDVRDFVGREFTACGRVVLLGCSKSGDTVVLGLDRPGEAGSVSIGVRTAQRPVFGEWFEDPYLGAEVCATGRVERMEKKYVVVVDAPASLALQTPDPPDYGSVVFESRSSCGTGVHDPKLVREVKPMYTSSALRAKIQGSVTLEAVVGADGKIGDVRVVKSLDAHAHEGLDAEAVKAAYQWRFTPALRRGLAVPVRITIELGFKIK
jgi:TonB family protein